MRFYIYGKECVFLLLFGIGSHLVIILLSSKMQKHILHGFVSLLVLCTSLKTITSESGVIHDFINGISNASEIAVVIDLSDGNVEKVKESWNFFDTNYDGEVTFGVINGSGYETTTNLNNFKEVGLKMKELLPSVKMNASSSDLFRYLLKTMSLMAPESQVLLFTGRMTDEGPLQKACLDKLQEKQTRLYVIWTGNSTNGIYALRSLAEASNGSFEMVYDVLNEDKIMISKVDLSHQQEISTEEDTSMQVIPKPVILSKMIAPSERESFGKILEEITIEDEDKTIKKSEKVKFPELEPEEKQSVGPLNTHMLNTNLSMEKQQSKSSVFIPIRVEVSSRSNLEGSPGTQQQIQYDVKNNYHIPLRLRFVAVRAQNLVVTNIQPEWHTLQPLETKKVDVTYQSSAAIPEGGEGTLHFAASTEWGGITPLPTIITFSSTPRRDTRDPEISYSYLGDCRGHDKPDTCDTGEWKLKATFQDETSGLKKVLSEPYGLVFQAPFTAGTKSPVTVFYSASCCQPKIDIWAEDGQGNYITRSFDVNNQGLLAGEIAAVVLGVLLLLCIIIGIIVTIIIVKKRKQNKLIIPRYQGSN